MAQRPDSRVAESRANRLTVIAATPIHRSIVSPDPLLRDRIPYDVNRSVLALKLSDAEFYWSFLVTLTVRY